MPDAHSRAHNLPLAPSPDSGQDRSGEDATEVADHPVIVVNSLVAVLPCRTNSVAKTSSEIDLMSTLHSYFHALSIFVRCLAFPRVAWSAA